jgi:large subunit ribosomal protein L23
MKATIIKQLDTEKTHKLLEGNRYTFLVSRTANKDEIKKDVETVFGVKVVDVRTTNCPVKNKSFRGNDGRMSQYKKAYVLVANGMKIDFGEKVEAK